MSKKSIIETALAKFDEESCAHVATTLMIRRSSLIALDILAKKNRTTRDVLVNEIISAWMGEH